MITVNFFYNDKKIKGFSITGHSTLYQKLRYKIKKRLVKNKKFHHKDYICSAVSAVAYMAVIGIDGCGKKLFFKQNDSGFLECQLKERPDKHTEIVFLSLLKTLKGIEKEYPGNIEFNLEA